MKKHRNRLSSDDEEFTNRIDQNNYQHFKKPGNKSPKNVELCLEVEMDDEVRKIIKSPEECPSTLLDVTVIKPKELHHSQATEKTTLKKDEVKKLIASMEIEKEDKRKLLDKIFGTTKTVAFASTVHDNISSSSKPIRKRPNSPKNKFQYSGPDPNFVPDCCPTDTETLSALVSSLKKRTSPGRKASLSTIDEKSVIQQIYTTPKTYNSIKSLFACKNKGRHDENRKPNQPCPCQNCAIVGILTDSQKKPFATEEMYDPREADLPRESLKPSSGKSPHRKKSVSFKKPHIETAHTECQQYIKQLSGKIQDLELRLAAQEEKAVPKEYFKRIITKLVNHISKLTRIANEEKSSYLSHNNKYKPASPSSLCIPPIKNPGSKYNKYYVSPVLITDQKGEPLLSEQNCGETLSSERFWRWGSEILKPGIDLKNKIASMLEETIQNFKKVWDKEPKHQENLDEEMKFFVEEVSKNLCKAIRDTTDIHKEQGMYRVNSSSEISSRFTCEGKRHKNLRNDERKLKERPASRNQKEEMCDVSYVNPKMMSWLEESQVSFKIESDIESSNKFNKVANEQYKAEFIKTLEHTKASEKFKLWQSIWNQALANGQNKNDRVTIQMPDAKEKFAKRTISIDFTIGEMESILVGKNGGASHKKARVQQSRY